MIVDDEMSFTDMLGRLLEDYFDCPVLTFGNPLTALDAIARTKVAFVVTDYYMPHLSGLEFIRRVAEKTPSPPPFLLITGHTLEDDPAILSLPCFKGTLAKPFRWQQLAALIQADRPPGSPLPVRKDARGLF